MKRKLLTKKNLRDLFNNLRGTYVQNYPSFDVAFKATVCNKIETSKGNMRPSFWVIRLAPKGGKLTPALYSSMRTCETVTTNVAHRGRYTIKSEAENALRVYQKDGKFPKAVIRLVRVKVVT